MLLKDNPDIFTISTLKEMFVKQGCLEVVEEEKLLQEELQEEQQDEQHHEGEKDKFS